MARGFPTLAEFFDTMPGGGARHFGNGRANRLNGTDADDMIAGRGGRDRLDGGDGDDRLAGGSGADQLRGGDGDDLLLGQRGNDHSMGGKGNDYIRDMQGHNRVQAGSGDDAVRTGRGHDKIQAGDGDDMVMAGRGRDMVYGGDGDDALWGQGGHDKLDGGEGDDRLYGGAGRDRLDGGDGDDMIAGGRGHDIIKSQFGNDVIYGGGGNDKIMLRSDGGEPVIAQNPALARYYPDNPIEDADDVISGGRGADTFLFRLDIAATEAIARKHADANGVINWQAVAGENDNPHDHWVNGNGDDVITDFSKAQGDKIQIKGHTVVATVEHYDADDDGTMDSTLITLKSDQGGNGGAHDQDRLGTIRVEDALLTDADVSTDRGVFYGAHETINDLLMA